MSLILADSAAEALRLDTGWALALSPPGHWADPDACDAAAPDWIPAHVPGTAAAALERAGRWHRDAPAPLHDRDVWYRLALPVAGPGRLRFDGLSTVAEAWLDGDPILRADDMFAAHEAEVEARPGAVLHLAFRSLDAALAGRTGKRARWRTNLIPDARLRFVRTTLLGHMPGWTPPIDTVGPWLPVTFTPVPVLASGAKQTSATVKRMPPLDRFAPLARTMRTSFADGAGRLTVALTGAEAAEGTLACAGRTAAMRPDAEGRLSAMLDLPGIEPWWPHTHGEPALHAVTVALGGRTIALGPVGFRSVVLDRGPDGRDVRLLVNGRPVFCRGAAWMPPDPVDPGADGEALERSLRLVVEAGLNMLRISGATIPPPERFHRLCDRLGILVWQDLMLANFDYPLADPAFAGAVAREAAGLLEARAGSPSFAVLCGGSEVFQQAAMMGLPPAVADGAFLRETVPGLVAAHRPGTILVANSPSGGDLPFAPDAGCTHYYGVGAYLRPPEDARRAGVRFASECLAFSALPEPGAGSPMPPLDSREWKAGVPRDGGADWDFEDVRDHYLRTLYGADPARLRATDPERYAYLSRAVVAELIEGTVSEWRRPGSGTHGALVWTWADLRPGAGWGLLDAAGQPKSGWHGLRRASRPLALLASDEGLAGLGLHVVNDGAAPLEAILRLACLRDGHLPVARGQLPVSVPARSGLTLSSAAVLGRFFDVTAAYRFGPTDHDLSVATLEADDGTVLASATHWLPGRRTAAVDLGLTARPVRDGDGWALHLRTARAAAAVAIADATLRPDDGYFDLLPGQDRTVLLRGEGRPAGLVHALNAAAPVAYAAPG